MKVLYPFPLVQSLDDDSLAQPVPLPKKRESKTPKMNDSKNNKTSSSHRLLESKNPLRKSSAGRLSRNGSRNEGHGHGHDHGKRPDEPKK